MKKMLALLLSVIILPACVACGQRAREPIDMEPNVSQMKAICELAVMECYYHNVAKYFDENAVKGFLGIGNKDKHFWIEYNGIVKLGIDISLVKIEIADSQITVTLPEAKVLSCEVNSTSLSENSFIVDKKSADIEADDEVRAFAEAQSKLEEEASNNKALLASAQQRAQILLEKYIMNIGEIVGKQYSIQWIYVDADGNSMETVVNETVTSGESEKSAE